MRDLIVNLILEAVESGARVARACETVGLSKRTYERWRANSDGDLRQGPKTAPRNKLSATEKKQILDIAISPEFRDVSPALIVPTLADRGCYIASESSFYRVLRQEKLAAHRGKSKPRTNSKPKGLIATGPNQVYSWDITYLPTSVRGTFLYLYMFVDIFSRKIVGYEVHEKESAEHAAQLLKNICEMENILIDSLTLHSDNGSPMTGATMIVTIQKLGVIPSFSRPSVSNDNPYSEALFKTVKYCPQYPSKPFASLANAREWCEQFVEWYNNEHLHSGIKYVTPASRHEGRDEGILRLRKDVYEAAKAKAPLRWSGETRNWSKVDRVLLNWPKDSDKPEDRDL